MEGARWEGEGLSTHAQSTWLRDEVEDLGCAEVLWAHAAQGHGPDQTTCLSPGQLEETAPGRWLS